MCLAVFLGIGTLMHFLVARDVRAQHEEFARTYAVFVAQFLLEPAAVGRAEERNRREARRVRPIAVSPQESRIGYVEHLEAYSSTDRSHVAPPPHRSHHYRTSC